MTASTRPVEPTGAQPAPMEMLKKLGLTALLVFIGAWLLMPPQGKSWQDCTTPKGIICVPKVK
jgi:hypothetical protein